MNCWLDCVEAASVKVMDVDAIKKSGARRGLGQAHQVVGCAVLGEMAGLGTMTLATHHKASGSQL